jgi:hypothetical protein
VSVATRGRRLLSDPLAVTATASVLLGVGWVEGAAVVVLVATGAGAGHSLSGSV